MSSDGLSLADFGAELSEPVSDPTVLAPERETADTTSVELDAFDSGLASGVSTATLQDLADDADSVDDVVAELPVDIATAREDLASIDRLEDVQTPFEAQWGVSQATLLDRARSHGLDDDGPRERFCDECGNRVTRVRDDEDAPEAGHKKGDRPEQDTCSQFIGGDG